MLDASRAACAREREHAWNAGARPARVILDIGAALSGAHSEKDGSAGAFKGGFGFPAAGRRVLDAGDAFAVHVDLDVGAHTLRRTFASIRAEINLSPRRAMYLLGHADPTLTMRVYQ